MSNNQNNNNNESNNLFGTIKSWMSGQKSQAWNWLLLAVGIYLVYITIAAVFSLVIFLVGTLLCVSAINELEVMDINKYIETIKGWFNKQ